MFFFCFRARNPATLQFKYSDRYMCSYKQFGIDYYYLNQKNSLVKLISHVIVTRFPIFKVVYLNAKFM